MQTYGAALTFSDARSTFRNRFWHSRLPFLKSVRENDNVQSGTSMESGLVKFLRISNDKRTVVTFSNDATVRVYNIGTLQCQRELVLSKFPPETPELFRFSEICHLLAILFKDGEIRVWSTEMEGTTTILTNTVDSFVSRTNSDYGRECLDFSANSQLLVSVHHQRPREALVWNLKKERLEHKCPRSIHQ